MVRKYSKKGQAAIEFLMTYGWMLLVVLIVGALIFSFVDFGTLLPNQLDLSNSFKGDAQRMSATTDQTNNFQFVVKYIGSVAGQIDLTNSPPVVSPIGGKSCSFVEMTDASNGQVSSGVVSFVNGQESVLTFTCTNGGGGNLVKGDVLEGEISIPYSDPRTPSLKLKSTGSFRVSVTN